MAKHVNLCPRQFSRRFRSDFKSSPGAFVQRLRLDEARNGYPPPTVPWRASPARSAFTILTVFAAPLRSVSVSRLHTTEAVSSPARKAKPLVQRLLFPTFYPQRPSMSPPSRGCSRRFFRDRARRVIFAAAPQSLDKISFQISVSRKCSSSRREPTDRVMSIAQGTCAILFRDRELCVCLETRTIRLPTMLIVRIFALFVITAIAEILGCYLPYLWLKKNGLTVAAGPGGREPGAFRLAVVLAPGHRPAASMRHMEGSTSGLRSHGSGWSMGSGRLVGDLLGAGVAVLGMVIIVLGPRHA